MIRKKSSTFPFLPRLSGSVAPSLSGSPYGSEGRKETGSFASAAGGEGAFFPREAFFVSAVLFPTPFLSDWEEIVDGEVPHNSWSSLLRSASHGG